MTNIATSVQEVLQIISDLRGESSTNTDASRIRAVSRANQDFAGRKRWSFYFLPNQTTVGSGVSDYTIGSATNPMRHKGLVEVFVANTADAVKTYESERHAIVDFNEFKLRYNNNNSEKMVYVWYDSANDLWKMHINPAPASTETITYTYFWEPPDLTLTTDKVICPDPQIIALLALAEIFEGEDETELAIVKKNEAEQAISDVVGQDNTPALGQLYTVKANENQSGNNGIGTY